MNSTSSQTLFKICLFSLILQLILWLTTAKNINNLRYTERNLVEAASTSNKVNCTFRDNVCKCPYSCYEQYENEKYCVVKKCYTYDENLGQCKQQGYHSTGPIVLQAIPFTGVFGSGFGNIGRWDLFGIYMGVFFGGCSSIIILSVCCLCACPSGNEEGKKEGALMCFSQCSVCLWAIAILVFYILGLIWITNPGTILDGAGCPLIFG